MLPSYEEDAEHLQFGTHFSYPNAIALSNVEVLALTTSRANLQEKMQEENPSASFIPLYFNEVHSYVNKFTDIDSSKLSQLENLKSTLLNKKFDSFEIATLINFQPESPQEAEDLLPSLRQRFQPSELEVVLRELNDIIEG
ncbi:hypothetical protein P9112_008906 [Eukaryota sp. TZLM1-RC]